MCAGAPMGQPIRDNPLLRVDTDSWRSIVCRICRDVETCRYQYGVCHGWWPFDEPRSGRPSTPGARARRPMIVTPFPRVLKRQPVHRIEFATVRAPKGAEGQARNMSSAIASTGHVHGLRPHRVTVLSVGRGLSVQMVIPVESV